MVPLAAFLPYVLPHVVTCPNPLAEQVVRSVCIDFCNDTSIIQVTSTKAVRAGVQDYDVDTPSQMVFSYVLDAFYGASRLNPVSLEEVHSGSALTGATVGTDAPATGNPTSYFLKAPGVTAISLFPIPDAALANGLSVRAAYAPSRKSTSVADALFNDWVEVISAGAVARLLSIPNQTFGDGRYAPVYAQQYASGRSSAITQARKGQLVVSSRIQPRFLA